MPDIAAPASERFVLLHDGTFEGFLTAVFEAFRLRLLDSRIASNAHGNPTMFEFPRSVETDSDNARRVWEGVLSRGGSEVAAMYRSAFLSEDHGIDDALWRCLRDLFAPGDSTRGRNLLEEHVHVVHGAACRTRHEAHRFLGFVRFHRAADGTLCAVIAPDHDILELLGPHFSARLPGQSWMIADSRRGRVLRSDGIRLHALSCDPAQLPRDARQTAALFPRTEDRWQALWTTFYDSVDIAERRNPRQLARLLPRKYWDHLPERTRREAGSASKRRETETPSRAISDPEG